MQFQIRHTFPCTAEAYWAAFDDPAFNQLLDQQTSAKRTLLSEHTQGDTKMWRMRCEPERTLPGPIQKILGVSSLSYEQQNRLGPDHVLHWEVFPNVLPDKVTAKGTVTLIPKGNREVERLAQGEITVRLPLVGGRVEQAILTSLTESYDRAAEATVQWFTAK